MSNHQLYHVKRAACSVEFPSQGMDISAAMLDVGFDREVEGDMCLQDLGQGLPLRPGSFDGAISISAVQWLCNADSAGSDPRRRMRRFFESLYASLTRGGRAVLQVQSPFVVLCNRVRICPAFMTV